MSIIASALAAEIHTRILIDLLRRLSTILGAILLRETLQQHTPRSLIWKRIHKWEDLLGQLESSVGRLRQLIAEEAEGLFSLMSLAPEQKIELLKVFVESLVSHFRDLALGRQGFEGVPYLTKRFEDQQTEVKFGPFFCVVPDEMAADVQRVHGELMAEGTSWEEYRELQRYSRRLIKLQTELRDDLAVLILRRVVPGHRHYCPF